MASGSSRTRIDQFFASKKRKSLSPGLKSGRVEKIAKITCCSPSAKGNLDNYLKVSQDDNYASKSLYTACGSLTMEDAVKRNLVSEISQLPGADKEKKQAFAPTHMCKESSGVEGTLKRASQDSAARDLGEGTVSADGTGNLELKQFATDFLSLYCSELQSSLSSPSGPETNDCRRHGSLTLMGGEDRASNNRSMSNQLKSKDVMACPNLKNLKDVTSPKQVIVGKVPIELPTSLRKCNKASKSFLSISECHTPGSSIIKMSALDTPKSARGSSIFSPGEAFWNEAIQVVDGMFIQTDSFVAAEIKYGNNQYKANNSYSLENMDCCEKMKIPAEGKGGLQGVRFSASLQLLEKHKKDYDKEVSPLPVKHFDFLSEEKNGDGSSPHPYVGDTLKDIACRVNEPSECGSVSCKVPQAVANLVQHCNVQTTEQILSVQERTFDHPRLEKKVDLPNQNNNDLITSNSSINVIGKVVGNSESDEASTPSSFMVHNNNLDLSNWLPSEICNTYRRKGIPKLYPWQVECLQVDGVLERRNLVYCASTSAGKSFVAEILMLRRVISSGKMALLVLPYVSICAEKAEHLEVLLEPVGKHVRSYYGVHGGGTLPKDTSVAVCTIEKANSLINRLLEEGRLSEIGIVVIDELHMVGDQSRGYLLELMLTKLRYAAGEGSSETSSGESSGRSSSKADPLNGVQIVGMSATMPNVAAVANWLQAALYQTDFRPVPLEEYIKVGNSIFNKKLEIVRTIPKAADLGGKDPDHIVELCNEVVQEGHSVLIFCSSRRGCESTARHVAKFIRKISVSVHENNSEFVDIASAIDALQRSPAGVDPILEETLPLGVAYHHAGLTVEEREIVESCYRRGLVHILTATSTLAAGVNLPARRVIFRQPRIGRDFVDGTRYKQMAGRAGRTGIDTKGESVLICKPEEVKRIKGLLNESCPALHSCLSEDKNGMTHAILEVVAGGIVQTANDIHRYVRCTLLNSTRPFHDVVKSAQDSLRWLCHRKFLEWNEDTKLYNTTPLGRAAFGSSLCPEESLVVLDDLSRAREGFVLASDLHLVYLVTPINVDVEPDWELYYERFMELSPLDQSVGNRVGVVEPFLMRMAHGVPIGPSNRSRDRTKGLHGKSDNRVGILNYDILSDEQTLRVCKRFYVALILSRLVQEAPVSEVCNAFKVARGMVQSLQDTAGRFASMVSVFCERLGWHDLEGLVAKFQNRVSFGVRAEIAELTSIPYVKGSRARALYKAGLRTPLAIAEASVPEIMKALFETSSWAAQDDSVQRRVHLGVAKKIKNGARKIVLEKAEEARIAAFSAFKLLGLNVPQLSQPLLLMGDRSPAEKEAIEDGISSSFVYLDQIEHVPNKMLENLNLSKVPSESEGEKLAKTSDVSLGVSTDINLTAYFSAAQAVESKTHGNKLDTMAEHVNGTDANASFHVGKTGVGIQIQEGFLEPEVSRYDLSPGNVGEKGPTNATNIPGGLDSFLDLWESKREFYFDIHYNKCPDMNSVASFEIHGIAICWENSPVYYINLPKDLLLPERRNKNPSLSQSSDNSQSANPEYLLEIVKQKWSRIGEIMGKSDVKKFTWNLKIQIQVLKCAVVSIQRFARLKLTDRNMGLKIIDDSYLLLSSVHIKDCIDLCIVAWILWPDEERNSNPNLEKEVKRRLSVEAAATAHRSGRWKNQMRRVAHNGCCCRVAQTRALCSHLWKILISEDLVDALMNIEIPLVNVLADMELWGIGVDLEGCVQARNVLGKKLRCIEKEAYKLAGMTFSLYTAADIANVLYRHLKLPIPEGHSKGKQHPSTDKHCLDILRNEHPIIPVIKKHRSLAKLFNGTLGSICSLARLSTDTQRYTIHGHWLQTSTATGRVSIEEPNLQCVEHMVDLQLNEEETGVNSDGDSCRINARNFFLPTQENWLLLAADYSQIELRLMAHFSGDTSLIELLRKPQSDVFTMIAARWTGRPEDSVSSLERDQAKRLVYGILYGMGANTLAEHLNCSSDDAKEKIRSFKSSFPGVASWLHEAVSTCRQKGYVKTLMGRKRFLSKIKFGNNKEKSKAQRQAVNSICQGSAADIIKIAMIKIYSIIVGEVHGSVSNSSLVAKYHMLKGRCRILLQVHDELVLEVDPSAINEAASLLKMSMESAAFILVPLHVKLKVGRTWGSLETFEVDQCSDKAILPIA